MSQGNNYKYTQVILHRCCSEMLADGSIQTLASSLPFKIKTLKLFEQPSRLMVNAEEVPQSPGPMDTNSEHDGQSSPSPCLSVSRILIGKSPVRDWRWKSKRIMQAPKSGRTRSCFVQKPTDRWRSRELGAAEEKTRS